MLCVDDRAYTTSSCSGTPELAQAAAPSPDSSGPSIFTAVQEQLGLRLESTKAVEVLVLDSVQKPTEN